MTAARVLNPAGMDAQFERLRCAISCGILNLRKMAIDGYIIYVDTKDIKEMNKLLSAIGRNINQIAKRVNAEGPIYQADMEEIRERLDQIWQLQRRILLSQR